MDLGVQGPTLILGRTTEEEDWAKMAIAEHAQILAALMARDGPAAEAAMRRHMEAAHRTRLRQICVGRDGWERGT